MSALDSALIVTTWNSTARRGEASDRSDWATMKFFILYSPTPGPVNVPQCMGRQLIEVVPAVMPTSNSGGRSEE